MFSGSFAGLKRISKSPEIRLLRRRGRRIAGRYLVLWVLKTESENAAALGITAGPGHAGSVERNTSKRRTRGCIMDLRDMLVPGFAYLIESRPGASGVDYQELVDDAREVLRLANAER